MTTVHVHEMQFRRKKAKQTRQIYIVAVLDQSEDNQTMCAMAVTKYPQIIPEKRKKEKRKWCITLISLFWLLCFLRRVVTDWDSPIISKQASTSPSQPAKAKERVGGWGEEGGPRSRNCGRTGSLPVISVSSEIANLTNYTLPWPSLAHWPGFLPALTTHI